MPAADHTPPRQKPLALSVGCQFGLTSTQPAVAIVQVAPSPRPGVAISGENWYTSDSHHSYTDGYGNRCERFELAAGGSHLTYEARLLIAEPADLIVPDTPETPVASLPDEVLGFIMPSR